MNDSAYVTQLLRQLKIDQNPALFNALFVMYVHRYRQVLQNTTNTLK